MVLAFIVAVTVTILFRNPATTEAMKQYRNAMAADIELDVAYKAQQYALDIRCQEILIQITGCGLILLHAETDKSRFADSIRTSKMGAYVSGAGLHFHRYLQGRPSL